MARIRSIKPEFCTSDQIVECSTNARLLFVQMWMFCDDNGVHPASTKRLKMECFPADPFTDAQMTAMVKELLDNGLLREYSVKSDRYWIVTGWEKHQKIDRPNPKFPLPLDDGSSNDRRMIVEPSPPEGKGREWKGKEGNKKEPSVPKKRTYSGIPKTVEEVIERGKVIGLSEYECRKFWISYHSKGWKVGKNPMVCWHTALAGWKLRAPEYTNGKGKPTEPEKDTRSFADRVSSYPNRTHGGPS